MAPDLRSPDPAAAPIRSGLRRLLDRRTQWNEVKYSDWLTRHAEHVHDIPERVLSRCETEVRKHAQAGRLASRA